MITTNPDKSQTLHALEQIETLALLGGFGNTLTALTARLLASEIGYAETAADALERAEKFIVQCEVETLKKAS